MIKVSVMYPRRDGARFDIDYYVGKHLPLVWRLLGPDLKRVEVDQGLAGGGPEAPPIYIAMALLHFDSVDAFLAAFGPHAAEILGDIPNYTDISPAIQVSTIL
ncbi:EthD family reductase [Aromatoleum evansii]|uniref:EthD family reductase n=1 Tax=Aromatoleum evansii TaxID=59406 RepID=A0ABZ1AS62_AROEV|nr:EthD family reductase [Aromatoleum evansii]